MSSDEIDMGFYCNHKAIHMVKANDRFVIYGPVIMNSEVLAYKGNIVDQQVLGIGQDRKHIWEQVRKSYPNIKETQEMVVAALGYTLENKQIDIAAIDVSKAALLSKYNFAPISQEDYISYSLIVRKDLIDTEAFDNFLVSYNKAVEELNKKETMISVMGMTKEFWDMVNLKFLEL